MGAGNLHLAICLLLLCSCGGAQSQPATQAPPPVSSYQGKVLFLRSLCGDRKLAFDAEGKIKAPCHYPVPFTLAALSIKNMKVKDGKLIVHAEKLGLYREPKAAIKTPKDVSLHPVELHAALDITVDAPTSGSSTEESFAPPLTAIFTRDYAALNVPDFWQKYIAEQKSPQSPHPSAPFTSGKSGVKDPKLTYSVEPELTQEAIQLRASGVCLFGLIVDAQGLPTQIHVIHPIGVGLDDQAAAAVEKYRFSPATKDGQPVPERIAIEVNFTVCRDLPCRPEDVH